MPARQTNGAVAYDKGVWFWHPWLVSSWRRFAGPNRASGNRQFAGDGGKRNSSPGSARYKPSNPLRRKGRMPRLIPVCSCAFSLRLLHTRPRVPASTRPSLHPLNFLGLENSSTTRAQRVAGMLSLVIAREGGRSSIPETPVIESTGRGVLDAPPSRGMTNGGGATAPSQLPCIRKRKRAHPPRVLIQNQR